MGIAARVVDPTALLGLGLLAGCGSGGSGDNLSSEAPALTVTFKNYCAGEVDVYSTDRSGSSCTKVNVSGPVHPVGGGSPNVYSASTTAAPDCSGGTRVEITQGTNGDVSYDISTNGTSDPSAPFFNVPVQFIALQSTAGSTCALPVWDGGFGPLDLRGVSSQTCENAQCPTAYQTPTSGPQFIARETAASQYVVEWCPSQNPSPIPTCEVPPFDAGAPCPNVCWEDAAKSPAECSSFQQHLMCNIAPFGGDPPASYCLLASDCTSKGGQPCGCCASNADCGGGKSCVNFLCQ